MGGNWFDQAERGIRNQALPVKVCMDIYMFVVCVYVCVCGETKADWNQALPINVCIFMHVFMYV